MAYNNTIDGGTMRSEVPEPRSGYAALQDVVLPRYLCTYGISGWITAALEMSGGQDVQVEETACAHDGAPTCQWRAHWS